ncbi:MAG: ABC transporter ATP-binding protein [Alphaproteobacteria bacterium]|jgi:branched-chain amino acid transport system ATP-binding protein|nr:ABC transporter ATP-binding protein [Alphaproteobacteria bacterium]MDP6239092.1 ABC transporter ATP-binding protein [Alphaproteobacteria bacterium]MDP7174339.1 ABC transporter ATP-binding protein [Alphaproteobacteria bacterium]MDP7234751.1 ABC transporter ATP-binding protein [Alphaproteobacteria bacterium]MDP7487949.1 ABC transporter ATP-binding protein [Alphaproteobacteria bacterium]|tara:strand:- start:2922 stop:3671 length:750 start_codon:yes stop_codon:yes gene_type:complete
MSVALELIDVHKSFGKTEIIHDVDLAVEEGERHAIIGPNGAGKSTLYNLISGLFPVSRGSIRLRGEDISGASAFEINRKGLSRSFQVTNIFHRMTVYDNVRCSTLWSQGHRYAFWKLVGRLKDVAARTEHILEEIGLTAKRDWPAGLLSYADQRALELGITIAGGADVLLLDEPTAGMSHSESAAAVALIRRISEGKTLLVVEHDMSVVFNLADRISVLVYGQIIATGTPDEIRANTDVQAAYLGTGAS